MKTKPTRPLVFRIGEQDLGRVDNLVVRLGLNRSEILRRSIRVAFPILSEVLLPGSVAGKETRRVSE